MRFLRRPWPKPGPMPPLKPWSAVTIPEPSRLHRQPAIPATWAAVHEAVREYTALAPTREWRRAWITLGGVLRRLERLERARDD